MIGRTKKPHSMFMTSKTQHVAARAASIGVSKVTLTSDRVGKRNTIQVAVRVRPLNEKEAAQGSNACVDVTGTRIQLAEKQFDFDAVFDTTAEQVFYEASFILFCDRLSYLISRRLSC